MTQQLCVAEDFSDCTVDLLSNDVCDAECNNEYCMWFRFGSSFTTPQINEYGRAADDQQCPYNESSDSSMNYTLCAESAADSAYIDPNLPTDYYALCDSSWIGDGIC